jgi:hypothetical protein
MHRIMDRTDSPPPEVWHKWNMRETDVHHHSKRVLTHYPALLILQRRIAVFVRPSFIIKRLILPDDLGSLDF